jgi:quercetin dioxygenase-like cupin family protein
MTADDVVTTPSSDAMESDGPTRIIFFGGGGPRAEEEMMSAPAYPPGVRERLGAQMMPLGDVMKTTVLFRQDSPPAGEDGYSIVHFRVEPACILPTHSHNVDCLYYVLSGSAVMGTRVLGPGSGFFVPANKRYGYQAGPDGVEVLEFRHATSFDMNITESSPARWTAIIDRAKAASDALKASGAAR